MTRSPSVSVSSTSTPSQPSQLYPQFILFGDSITEKATVTVQAKLTEFYSRRLDVLNRGFGGYTAPMGLDALTRFFPAVPPSSTVPRVRLMTVFFGANDASIPGQPQHVPLQKYQDALHQIATYKGLRLHATKVIFISPPPVDEWQLSNDSRNAANTARYAAGCRSVAADLGFPILDLWTIFMTMAGWKKGEGQQGELPGSKEMPKNPVLADLLLDGLHLSPAAYQVIYDELIKMIRQDLPDELPENLPFMFPPWRAVLGVPL